jgi:pyruvate-formate lyase-activating enzyme
MNFRSIVSCGGSTTAGRWCHNWSPPQLTGYNGGIVSSIPNSLTT